MDLKTWTRIVASGFDRSTLSVSGASAATRLIASSLGKSMLWRRFNSTAKVATFAERGVASNKDFAAATVSSTDAKQTALNGARRATRRDAWARAATRAHTRAASTPRSRNVKYRSPGVSRSCAVTRCAACAAAMRSSVESGTPTPASCAGYSSSTASVSSSVASSRAFNSSKRPLTHVHNTPGRPRSWLTEDTFFGRMYRLMLLLVCGVVVVGGAPRSEEDSVVPMTANTNDLLAPPPRACRRPAGTP
mmetsp:Transcript_1983/g.7648  ORF Transcript_1983/g.7648 Transcript_1983/m.7648 type:complete len:249 (+) Transcript_1983:643-1389(+)